MIDTIYQLCTLPSILLANALRPDLATFCFARPSCFSSSPEPKRIHHSPPWKLIIYFYAEGVISHYHSPQMVYLSYIEGEPQEQETSALF